jgi:hypothetical protein
MDVPTTIVIKGVTIPVAAIKDLAAAVPTVLFGIGDKKSPDDIAKEIAPTAIAVIEEIAAVMFPPFGGTAIEIIAFLLANQQPWTKDEQQRWWDRAQGQA